MTTYESDIKTISSNEEVVFGILSDLNNLKKLQDNPALADKVKDLKFDTDSKSGMPGANRKVKGTIHWVSCAHCLQAEVRLYDRLWKVENPRDELAAIREEKNCDALTAMKEMINPDSLNVLPCCYIEKFAAGMKPLSYLQFQRIGYFNVDRDSTPEKMVFNRTVGLKDTWGKINK
jgi:glutaminyl-tRNA synthetase